MDEQSLRDTIEQLAAYERGPTSEGERRAAEWLEQRLRAAGCERVAVEQEEAYDRFAQAMALMSAAGAAGGLAALAGRRRLAIALGALAAAGIAEDASGGPRLFRRATQRKKPTWNVVAQAGDLDAERTLVLLAHHDAPPTGAVFDPKLQRTLATAFPGIVERMDTALPIWWTVIAGPLLAAAGAARGSARMAGAGSALAAGSMLSFADIARNRIVPGANDNLSGVAALVAVAEALRERPLERLRVLLVSCGSEEVLQGGIAGFAKRWFPSLPRESTWFLNVETVGSPRLVLLEGEGPFVMEDYTDRVFRDRVALAAERAGVWMRRGMRARASTDSIVPSRAGYPTATLTSVDRHKLLSNYHLPSDVPENVRYETVADAVRVCEEVARELAALR